MSECLQGSCSKLEMKPQNLPPDAGWKEDPFGVWAWPERPRATTIRQSTISKLTD